MPGAHGMEGTEDCAFVDMGAFPGVSPKLGAVGRSWLSCELPPTIIWRQGHWGVEIPAYTVALPRPPKPPLSSETLERNRRIKTPRGRVHLLTRKIYYRGNRFTQSAAAMTEIQSTIPEWLDSQAFLPNDFFADHENVHLTPSPLSNDGSRPSVSTSPIPAKRRLSSTLDSGEKAVSRKSKIQKVRQPKGRPRTSSNPSSPSSTSTETDRFACPFYKRYGRKMCQETPQNWHKNCIVGREISRIKNHLRKDYECNRCFDTFKTREQLTSHQRSPGCRLKPKDDKALILKIDRARFEQLRKKPPGESPEDYWREVYRIIFELDRTADVPSPCECFPF
ncbi:hypothetical protein GGS20DRAFT_241488 [Poronia punctata]|nr:hypothetical protein GGS20DRAFT_241488 [Poronia punctata]